MEATAPCGGGNAAVPASRRASLLRLFFNFFQEHLHEHYFA
jgi:hypothetical protein